MGHADEKMRDIASGPGGDAARAALPVADAEKAWQKMQRTFEELVDMARLSPEPLPVILVGGGAILVGDVSLVHMVPPPPPGSVMHLSSEMRRILVLPAYRAPFILEMIILPRQARDKHWESTGWLWLAGWLAGCLLAMPACYLTLRCMH